MTVISTCREALADAVTSAGIQCYRYEEAELQQPPPLATIQLDGGMFGSESEEYDQCYGIKNLRFLLFNYVNLDGNIEEAQSFMDGEITKVVTALGADPTLANKVINTRVANFDVMRETRGAQTYLVCIWKLTITPWANVG